MNCRKQFLTTKVNPLKSGDTKRQILAKRRMAALPRRSRHELHNAIPYGNSKLTEKWGHKATDPRYRQDGCATK